ncbi:MAG: hypothetical protein MHM6MM_002831 [Cercozoa sp. M6MM]
MAEKDSSNFVDFKADQEELTRFLRDFTDADGERVYMRQLQSIANRENDQLKISLDDLRSFFGVDEALPVNVVRNVVRYQRLLERAADEVMPQPDAQRADAAYDIEDMLAEARKNAAQEQNQRQPAGDRQRKVPAELQRRFHVAVVHSEKTAPLTIRQVASKHVGHLVAVRGVVTRASDVRPLARVVTYTCNNCSQEIYQVVTSDEFMPLVECPVEQCQRRPGKVRLQEVVRGSKFVPFQEVRVQELPSQMPVGAVPRTMTVHLLGPATRKCLPGDEVTVTGAFLPRPPRGFKALKKGLCAPTYLLAHDVRRHKKSFSDQLAHLSDQLVQQIEDASQDDDIYHKLAASIAPNIFGHADVKKALLLLLVGGVTKQMKDGMRIRGDINVLLVGDPGVAKSQLLKYVTHTAPRAVYTTGRGSSGVGLTAAVTKDPVTGALFLEGGALVLADQGVCCIDEFDKMDDSDRTAIHEVMEQQTVSIAKAGITTSLNARTCVLAAANPTYGRYNPKKSIEQNMQELQAALLSRFDLIFLLRDIPDMERDVALGRFVTTVHRTGKHPDLTSGKGIGAAAGTAFKPFESDFLRAYIARTRQCEPWVPKELVDFVAKQYVQLRSEARAQHSKRMQASPRALLSILRMAQAHARIHLRNKVTKMDVQEAMRLLDASTRSVHCEVQYTQERRLDIKTRIYHSVVNWLRKQSENTGKRADLMTVLTTKGFRKEVVQATLSEYSDNNVFQLTPHSITLVDG